MHLVNKLGVSRGIMSSTLERLVQAGVIQKNSGYGHPLRPEYLLTPLGEQLAPFCRELLETSEKKHLLDIIQPRWACPIIFATGEEEKRFNEIKGLLMPITSRALSESLKHLLEQRGLSKRLVDCHPPTVLYGMAKKAQPLYRIYKEHEGVIANYCFS